MSRRPHLAPEVQSSLKGLLNPSWSKFAFATGTFMLHILNFETASVSSWLQLRAGHLFLLSQEGSPTGSTSTSHHPWGGAQHLAGSGQHVIQQLAEPDPAARLSASLRWHHPKKEQNMPISLLFPLPRAVLLRGQSSLCWIRRAASSPSGAIL